MHAQFLANKVVALGGEPATVPRPVPLPHSNRSMLEAVLNAEIEATESYTQRAKEAEEYGDKGLVVQLEDFIRDESSHVEETERILRDWPLARGSAGDLRLPPDELSVLDPVRVVSRGAEAAPAVGLVVSVVSCKPHSLRGAFECQDVSRDTVQEPAVVTDDDGASGEFEQRVLERAERVDIEVVRRFVEQEEVRPTLEQLGHVHAIPLATGEGADQSLLISPLEVEPRDVGARC